MTCTECGKTKPGRRRNGLCDACYERARRARIRRDNPLPPRRPRAPLPPRPCKVCGGEHKKLTKGMCQIHYGEALRRSKGIPARRPKSTAECSEEGCDRTVYALGICLRHYKRAYYRRVHKAAPARVPHSTKIIPEVKYGVWTIGEKTTTLCWPPRDAGPDWKCECGRGRSEEVPS